MNSLAFGARCAVALTAAVLSLAINAQDVHDTRPLRIIVITPPGGQADTTARLLADGLGKSLQRTVIVENRAGAGGNIAAEYVASQGADAPVLLLTSNNHTVNQTLFKNVNYDYRASFEPVIQLTSGPSVIAAYPPSGLKSIADLVGLAKQRDLSYGSTGIGSGPHLAFEIFELQSAIKLVHVPFKGAGPAVTAVLGGQVPVVSVSLTSAIAHVKSGKLIALAVSSARRWPELPDVPTLEESGCTGCVYDTWLAMLAPKGASKAYVAEMNRQIGAVINSPEVREKLIGLGTAASTGTPEQLAAMLKHDYEITARIIKETGMTVE